MGINHWEWNWKRHFRSSQKGSRCRWTRNDWYWNAMRLSCNSRNTILLVTLYYW